MQNSDDYICWFKDIGINDIETVGGKNASLGELYQHLGSQNIRVPNGFALTAKAYRDFIQENTIARRLDELLQDIDPNDVTSLQRQCLRARELILSSTMPPAVESAIDSAFRELNKEYSSGLSVAARSSATAEDLPGASFAGQHDSYLNIESKEELLIACKKCFASLYNDRAVNYRRNKGFEHDKVAISVCIMKMVRSDLAASGTMFSLDTDSGFKDVVLINASYGLGENVVQGLVDPDEFIVHKKSILRGYNGIIKKHLGKKQLTMVYQTHTQEQILSSGGTINQPTASDEQARYCIEEEDIKLLARHAVTIEKYYQRLHDNDTAIDIEWAKDGIDNKIYIIQARPETVVAAQEVHIIEEFKLAEKSNVICSGHAIGHGVATGNARLIHNVEELKTLKTGEIIIASSTNPDWGAALEKAAAIVTDHGGRTCHAAIVSRELGIPAVIGSHNATQVIKNGQTITVSCAEGVEGHVFEGALNFTSEKFDIRQLPDTRTQIMLNIGNPDQAFKHVHLPCDGVGLARLEFIINNLIKVHPMALIHPEKLSHQHDKDVIEQMTRSFETPSAYFVETLAEGIATIAASFYPKPVIVRLSDFKSNEYAALIGGGDFEFEEDNPMIGFRGASRYSHKAYAEAFSLECQALLRCKNIIGLDNIKIMVPFCRRIEEAESVIQSLQDNGIQRGSSGFNIYMMCEIPNNIIQIDQFADFFDGISIGSNDLTQLVLGVDRDSELVDFDFDENDPGVLKMIQWAIEGAQRNKIKVGICGQAPSDYPDFARQIVSYGIDSISINPDAFIQIKQVASQAEQSSE